MKIELIAASRTFIENKSDNTNIFNGPPPIPRKAERVPNARPIMKINSRFLKLYVRMIFFNRVRMYTKIKMIARVPACSTVIKSGLSQFSIK